jgi:multiple sugar transport system substrate-binding protein
MLLSMAPISQGVASATQASSAQFGVGAKGTVTLWVRAATAPLAEILTKEFNASHPGLKVVIASETGSGQAVTKLATAIRSGSPPDLIGLNDDDMPVFTSTGAFLNITKYVKALPFFSKLSAGHLGLAQYDGQYYGTPYLADLSVLWYNKVLFKRAGITQPPTTYARILADAKKVRALGKSIYGISTAGECPGCEMFTVTPMIWAPSSADRLILGSGSSQRANIAKNSSLKTTLTLFRELEQAGTITPWSRTQTGATWGTHFVAGQVGMEPQGYGLVAKIDASHRRSDFGVVPLPGPVAGTYSTFDGGDDFAIPKGSKNPSGAWEFIKWVLEPKQQLQYYKVGYTPVRTDLLTRSYIAAHPFDAVALKALGHGYVPVSTAFNPIFHEATGGWQTMWDQALWGSGVASALTQGQTLFTSELSQTAGA